jgi:heat shock protein HslJ
VESAYLAGLAKAATYTATSQALTLFDASGKPVLVFAPSKPVLTDVTWHLVGYNNGKAGVVSTLAGTDLAIRFDTNGRLGGNAGCNQYSGPYTIKDDNIALGPLAATMMACARQDLADQETAYLSALATAAKYSVRGTRLELRAADGALAAHFERR